MKSSFGPGRTPHIVLPPRGGTRPQARYPGFLATVILATALGGCASPGAPPRADQDPSTAPISTAQAGTQGPAPTALGEPAPAEEDDRASTVTEWLQPADRKTRFPAGYRFTDQDGHAKSSKALQGKPSVVSFFFTRCDNPNKCPLIVRTFGTLQSELKAAGIESLVNLALVTYDPLYDTPARLRRYADELGLRFNPTTVMLRSEPNEKNKLFEDLDVAVNFDSRGVNIHRIQLLLLDTQGRIARVYHSLIWDNPAVLRDLKTLLAEPAADSAALPTS